MLHRLGRDEAELLFEVLQGARGADDVSVLVSEGEPVTDWQWRVGVLVTVPDVWSDARVDLEGDLATAARTIERPGRAGCGGRVTNQRCKGQVDGGKGCCADVFGLIGDVAVPALVGEEGVADGAALSEQTVCFVD